MSRSSYVITGDLARAMPRFEFIAFWLATVTRKKANRGRLGLYVRKVGKHAVRLRAPNVGPEVQKADHFRIEALTEHGKPGHFH